LHSILHMRTNTTPSYVAWHFLLWAFCLGPLRCLHRSCCAPAKKAPVVPVKTCITPKGVQLDTVSPLLFFQRERTETRDSTHSNKTQGTVSPNQFEAIYTNIDFRDFELGLPEPTERWSVQSAEVQASGDHLQRENSICVEPEISPVPSPRVRVKMSV
jgi:hypothetical protein